MDKHCVSLEISKELKEAGYSRKGEFYYSNSDEGIVIVSPDKNCKGCYGVFGKNGYEVSERSIICPAPLATELLEGLPGYLENQKGEMVRQLMIEKHEELDKKEPYYICYEPNIERIPAFEMYADTLSNALAKMWLYLRKEKLI
jgi:hypothetical protein